MFKIILAAVLAVMARGAYASGIEGLQSFSATDLAAQAVKAEPAVPAASRAVVSEADLAKSADNSAIRLTIKSDTDFKAAVSSYYRATRNILACTKYAWNEGSMERVPKTIRREFKEENDSIVIPGAIGTLCGYERTLNSSLEVSIPGQADPYQAARLYQGEAASAEQALSCKTIKIATPKGEREQVQCSGDVVLDSRNEATIRIIKEAAL